MAPSPPVPWGPADRIVAYARTVSRILDRTYFGVFLLALVLAATFAGSLWTACTVFWGHHFAS